MPPKEAFLAGRNSAHRALDLDDTLAEAHGTMGHVCMHLYEWRKAKKEFDRALQLNPNHVHCLYFAYYLAFNGYPDESINEIDRALQLDPLSLPTNRSMAELLYFAGRHGESISLFKKCIEMQEHPLAHVQVGRVYEHLERYEEALAEFSIARKLAKNSPETGASIAHLFAVSGKPEEARILLQELESMAGREYVSAYDFALVHAALGDKKEAFEWLDRAYEIHDAWMIYLTVDPRWKPFRSDPKYIEMVERIGLPQPL